MDIRNQNGRNGSRSLRTILVWVSVAALMGAVLKLPPAAAQSSRAPQGWRVAQGMGHGHAGTPAAKEEPAQPAMQGHVHQPTPTHAHEHVHAETPAHPAAGMQESPQPGVSYRVTMEQLHKMGGTPTGWRFALPAGDPDAGREAFIHLGCHTCHHATGGGLEGVTDVGEKPGMDLGGMGGMHPAEYFAESILNPNNVIIAGPGYTGHDGLSTMPDYIDSMTVRQLVDVVAYLQSLAGAHGHASHGMGGQPTQHE